MVTVHVEIGFRYAYLWISTNYLILPFSDLHKTLDFMDVGRHFWSIAKLNEFIFESGIRTRSRSGFIQCESEKMINTLIYVEDRSMSASG